MKSLAARAALAAALLAMPVLGAGAQAPQAPDRRPTLAVLNFDNGAIGRGADFEPLRSGLADLLITDLAANPKLRVVEREQLAAILQEQGLATGGRLDPATTMRIGKLLGVRHFITGGFVISPRGEMWLDARSFNTETGAIEYTERVRGNSDDVLDLISQLATKLNSGLRLPDLPEPAPAPAPGPDAAPAGNPSTGAGSTPSGGTKASGTPSGARVAKETSRSGGGGGGSSKASGGRFQAVMLYSRALAEEDKGNRQAAVELYRKSLDVFPDNDKAKARLARLEKKSD